jgi:hypothetical protein
MKLAISFALGTFVFFLTSCKEEVEQPKVIYAEESEIKETKIDTTQIKIADLPIQMEGTSFLLHPIGGVRVYESNSRMKSSYGSSSVNRISYSVSNYNRFEITGFLQNIYFQHIDSTSTKPLTDSKVVIQTATFLNTISDKTKKQILVYTLADKDTNRDGKVDSSDIKALYLSDISGSDFTKISPELQELVDWNLIESKNRLYFRTIEDTNKNGDFDKNDLVHYYYVDLLKEWTLNEYVPY